MNVIGYFLTLFFIMVVHILLKKFNDIQIEQPNLIEEYRNRLNPKYLDAGKELIEKQQKFIDFKDYDYKGPNFSLIEDEGYDIDNDYDAYKEDLMKYVEGANDYFKEEKRAEPVMTEERGINLKHNAVRQPLMNKKQSSFKTQLSSASMDNQFKNAFEKNNKERNSQLPYKSLKPDQWTYSNEKTINGGFFDESAGLMPFDASEELNYVLL